MTPEIKELIKNIPIFTEVKHNELLAVLDNCVVKEYGTGEYICKQGEYDENCCIVLSGEVSVQLSQLDTKKAKKIVLGEGEIFGEMAVLSGNPRTADIVTSRPTILLNISREELFKYIDRFPSIKEKLDDLYRERALSNHLLSVPLFCAIPAQVLEDLVNNVTLHTYHKGEVVFNQGDEADAFYFLRYGFVSIHQKADGKRRVLAYLKEGHFFGEMGLLKEDEKRMATVTTTSRAELVKVSKEDFQMIIDSHPVVRENLEKIVERRKGRNIQLERNLYLEHSLSAAVDADILQTKVLPIIDATKCIQCDNCVEACAALHGNQTRLTRKGIKYNNILLIPTSCRHCEDPTCMSKCPTGAIARNINGEIFHKDFCIGCGNCAENCPYENISIISLVNTNAHQGFFSKVFGASSVGNEDVSGKIKSKKPRRRAVMCDMCYDYDFLGCVYHCPTGAVRIVDPTNFFTELKAIS